MGKPFLHAKSSVAKFGGKASDYIKIHEKMDCSKGEIGDLRHRLLTHHMFFVRECIVPIFGSTLVNSDGKEVSVVEVCEYHILEDFSDNGTQNGFIPTAGDFLTHVEVANWMNNGEGGEHPYSHNKRVEWAEKKVAGATIGPLDTGPMVIDGSDVNPPPLKPNPYESIDTPDENEKQIAEIRKALLKQQPPYEEKHRRRSSFADGPMRFD